MIYFLIYFIIGFLIILSDWIFFVEKEIKRNGTVFLLPLCVLIWPIYIICVIIFRCFLYNKIKNKMKNKKTNGSSNLDKGFHPELLFLINRSYAEYVDFEEIK